MKYLSHYIEDAQSAALEKAGAFFAFGDKQYDEQAVERVKYTSMGLGLICPVGNAVELAAALESIHKAGIQQDLAENGAKGVIRRELGNYECQITGDWSDVVGILAPYGITFSDIKAEYPAFYQECLDNDYF